MMTDQISALLKADPRSVVSNDEARYRAQIARAVELVDANADLRPIVLLAGPSGSGKTSTAMLLSQGLRQKGRQSRTICMDDYFLPLSVEEQQRCRATIFRRAAVCTTRERSGVRPAPLS